MSAATVTALPSAEGRWLDLVPAPEGQSPSADAAFDDYSTDLDTLQTAGVLIVDHALRPSSWTLGARAWVETVHPRDNAAAPGLVKALVERLAIAEEQGERRSTVRLGIRAANGWAVAQASRLEGAGGIAVTIGPATADQALDLCASRCGLTPREREILGLLREGLDTTALTQRLLISRHTLQDHLKSMFRKTGVRSRLKLIAMAGSDACPA